MGSVASHYGNLADAAKYRVNGKRKSKSFKKKLKEARIAAKKKRTAYYIGKKLSDKEFFESREWRELRYRVLTTLGRRCMCCGATPDKNGITLHVDHVKPRSKHPELALSFANLQVLCENCNMGKGNYYEHDFRQPK